MSTITDKNVSRSATTTIDQLSKAQTRVQEGLALRTWLWSAGYHRLDMTGTGGAPTEDRWIVENLDQLLDLVQEKKTRKKATKLLDGLIAQGALELWLSLAMERVDLAEEARKLRREHVERPSHRWLPYAGCTVLFTGGLAAASPEELAELLRTSAQARDAFEQWFRNGLTSTWLRVAHGLKKLAGFATPDELAPDVPAAWTFLWKTGHKGVEIEGFTFIKPEDVLELNSKSFDDLAEVCASPLMPAWLDVAWGKKEVAAKVRAMQAKGQPAEAAYDLLWALGYTGLPMQGGSLESKDDVLAALRGNYPTLASEFVSGRLPRWLDTRFGVQVPVSSADSHTWLGLARLGLEIGGDFAVLPSAQTTGGWLPQTLGALRDNLGTNEFKDDVVQTLTTSGMLAEWLGRQPLSDADARAIQLLAAKWPPSAAQEQVARALGRAAPELVVQVLDMPADRVIGEATITRQPGTRATPPPPPLEVNLGTIAETHDRTVRISIRNASPRGWANVNLATGDPGLLLQGDAKLLRSGAGVQEDTCFNVQYSIGDLRRKIRHDLSLMYDEVELPIVIQATRRITPGYVAQIVTPLATMLGIIVFLLYGLAFNLYAGSKVTKAEEAVDVGDLRSAFGQIMPIAKSGWLLVGDKKPRVEGLCTAVAGTAIADLIDSDRYEPARTLLDRIPNRCDRDALLTTTMYYQASWLLHHGEWDAAIAVSAELFEHETTSQHVEIEDVEVVCSEAYRGQADELLASSSYAEAIDLTRDMNRSCGYQQLRMYVLTSYSGYLVANGWDKDFLTEQGEDIELAKGYLLNKEARSEEESAWLDRAIMRTGGTFPVSGGRRFTRKPFIKRFDVGVRFDDLYWDPKGEVTLFTSYSLYDKKKYKMLCIGNLSYKSHGSWVTAGASTSTCVTGQKFKIFAKSSTQQGYGFVVPIECLISGEAGLVVFDDSPSVPIKIETYSSATPYEVGCSSNSAPTRKKLPMAATTEPTTPIAKQPLAATTEPTTPVAKVSPSYDCAKASTQVENAICDDPDLARLDVTMAAAYKAARNRQSQADKTRLRDDQRLWLQERELCATLSDVKGCLRREISDRTADLRSW